MCCHCGKRRSGHSLIQTQLARLHLHLATLQLLWTVAPATIVQHGNYIPTGLQRVGMRRNGYENSNRRYAKASFLAPPAPYSAYDSSARETQAVSHATLPD